ncbi:hypothetical protein J2T56_003145 [Natronobacillus azotifigens]
MREADLVGTIIITCLNGGILTFFGAIIKYFQAGDMMNFFNPKKHDKYKTSQIVGNGLLITALIVFSISFLGIFI